MVNSLPRVFCLSMTIGRYCTAIPQVRIELLVSGVTSQVRTRRQSVPLTILGEMTACGLMKLIPKVIPPRSRVRLVGADKRTRAWRKDVGRRFRIGYYSRKDGLDCIWLVNDNGEYEQTTDREFLLNYFEIERLSGETNFYGTGKRRLSKLKKVTSGPARSFHD